MHIIKRMALIMFLLIFSSLLTSSTCKFETPPLLSSTETRSSDGIASTSTVADAFTNMATNLTMATPVASPSGLPNANQEINDLSQTIITNGNVVEVLSNLTGLLSNNTDDIDSNSVTDSATILMNAANYTSNISVTTDWMNAFNALLYVNQSVVSEAEKSNRSAAQILETINIVAVNTDLAYPQLVYNYLSNRSSSLVSVSIVEYNDSFNNPQVGIYQTDAYSVFPLSDNSSINDENINAFIKIPTSFTNISEITRVLFKIFDTTLLFVTNNSTFEFTNYSQYYHQAYSDVASGNLEGVETNETYWCGQTTFPVTDVVSATTFYGNTIFSQNGTILIKLKPITRTWMNSVVSCGYWDPYRNLWTNDGSCSCNMVDNGMYSCSSTHLTDFALLVTSSARNPALCDRSLNIAGFAMSAISSLSLFIVLLVLIFIYFRSDVEGRKRINTSSILYLGCLFLLFTLFTLASDQSRMNLTLQQCTIFAAILYACFLSTILCMCFKAFEFYVIFVIICNRKKWIKVILSGSFRTLVCFFLPVTVSLLIGCFKKEYFQRIDQFCWITPSLTLVGVVIPISVQLIISLFVTILVAYNFFIKFGSRRTFLRESNYRKIIVRRVWIIFSMQIFVTGPWVSQYCCLFTQVSAWDYVFTVLFGLQGLWILLIVLYEYFYILIGLVKKSYEERLHGNLERHLHETLAEDKNSNCEMKLFAKH